MRAATPGAMVAYEGANANPQKGQRKPSLGWRSWSSRSSRRHDPQWAGMLTAPPLRGWPRPAPPGLLVVLLEELAGHLGQGERVDGPVDERVRAGPAAQPLVLEPVEDEDDRAGRLGVGLEVAGQAEAAVGGDRDVGHHQVGQAGPRRRPGRRCRWRPRGTTPPRRTAPAAPGRGGGGPGSLGRRRPAGSRSRALPFCSVAASSR